MGISILNYEWAAPEFHAPLNVSYLSPNLKYQKIRHKTEHENPQLRTVEIGGTEKEGETLDKGSHDYRSSMKMEDVVILVDDFHKISYCRICHEAEFESCKPLEAPCACSGTVKFAHRECIQRWCDEKGDTCCEICLQKYEPGYTAIPKQPKNIVVLDQVVSIRESLEVPRSREELENPELLGIAEYTAAADRNASRCRTLAFIFTGLLLVRQLLDVLTGGVGHYPLSPSTVLILRTCGIIVPMYIIIRTITALQNSIRRHRSIHDSLINGANYVRRIDDEEEEQVQGRENGEN